MKKILNIAIISLIIVLVLLAIIFVKILQENKQKETINISIDKKEYNKRDNLKIKIKNNFDNSISFSKCYPYYLERKNENWERYDYIECNEINDIEYFIESNNEKTFETKLPENIEGTHRLAIPICINCQKDNFFKIDKIFYSEEFFVK